MCRVNLRHKIAIAFIVALFASKVYGQVGSSSVVNMVFSSDAHYGITRAKFRGDSGGARVIG